MSIQSNGSRSTSGGAPALSACTHRHRWLGKSLVGDAAGDVSGNEPGAREPAAPLIGGDFQAHAALTVKALAKAGRFARQGVCTGTRVTKKTFIALLPIERAVGNGAAMPVL
jgi:hypothetical protein